MQGLFIGYMILLILIFAAEYGFKLYAANNKKAFVKADVLRVIEPIKTLAALFAITVIELCVEDKFAAVTDGFVKATTIFFGIVAVIYVLNFAYEQYGLRGYERVIANTSVSAADFSEDAKFFVKVRGANYVRKFSTDYLNALAPYGDGKQSFKRTAVKAALVFLMLLIILIAGIVIFNLEFGTMTIN